MARRERTLRAIFSELNLLYSDFLLPEDEDDDDEVSDLLSLFVSLLLPPFVSFFDSDFESDFDSDLPAVFAFPARA